MRRVRVALVLALALAGCQEDQEKPTAATQAVPKTTPALMEFSAPPPPEPAPLK